MPRIALFYCVPIRGTRRTCTLHGTISLKHRQDDLFCRMLKQLESRDSFQRPHVPTSPFKDSRSRKKWFSGSRAHDVRRIAPQE